jgi:hypothetical protein
MTDDNRSVEPRTLRQFIENNHKLFSTVGVFAALSVVTFKLPEKLPGKLLAFFLFVMVLLICCEIYDDFQLEDKGRLYWFRELFGALILGYSLVWIAMFYPIVLVALIYLFLYLALLLAFAFLAMGIRKLLLTVPWFSHLSERKRMSIPSFGALALIAAVYAILRHFKVVH